MDAGVTGGPTTPAAAATVVRRPWLPGCLAAHGLTTDTVVELSYLVVEEMVEDVSAITVSSWPAADGLGRLRFDDTDIPEVAVATEMLHGQLYRGWLRRPPRIGDVFAAGVDPAVLADATDGVWRGQLAWLLPTGAYDISAEARKVAKLALHAARSDIVDAGEADANEMLAKAVRNRRAAPYRPRIAEQAEASRT